MQHKETYDDVRPKLEINHYGFKVLKVRILGEKGSNVLWECEDEKLIAESQRHEVNMIVTSENSDSSYQ